jgi:alkaline phosphatase
MTRAAIKVLQHNPNGFVLMVEGGRIDHGHHAGNAYRALTETIAFSDAIRAATELTSSTDTLIIVTADHSHTMTFAGYANRGNPILGKLRGSSGEGAPSNDLARDATGRSLTTLSYANGPGYAGASDREAEGAKRYPHNAGSFLPAKNGRPNLDKIDTEDPDYLQEATVPLGAETHSGEDVAVFAQGPGAAAIRGSLEQNALFHIYTQANPRIEAELCKLGSCDASGVAVKPPAYKALLDLAAAPAPK